jgi:hypothetical protein
MKRFWLLLVVVVFLLVGNGCATSKNPYYKKKHQTVKGRDYREKRGLMLLENTQLGRNKYFYSKQNQKNIRKRKK